MRNPSFLTLFLAMGLLSLILFSCAPGMSGQKVTTQKIDDIYFPDTHSMPPAWFSHEKHSLAEVKCSDCHNKIFPSKKGATDVKDALTMKAMEQGQYCGACHDGEKAFKVGRSCLKCHVKNTRKN